MIIKNKNVVEEQQDRDLQAHLQFIEVEVLAVREAMEVLEEDLAEAEPVENSKGGYKM